MAVYARAVRLPGNVIVNTTSAISAISDSLYADSDIDEVCADNVPRRRRTLNVSVRRTARF